MDLINVQPKEFLFMYGISHSELIMLDTIFNNMQFNYDGTKSEHIKAKEYLETKFYPSIQEGLKAVEDYNGD